MPDLKSIYLNEADRYQALVGREDYENHLLPAILAIDPLAGKTVVELSAGTGRVSALIAPLTNKLIISDISLHMLRYGVQRLATLGIANGHPTLESHRTLPFANRSADVMISGWSFCYAALEAGKGWQSTLAKALGEAQRTLRPGGKLILIESLGTGVETPQAPDVLQDYLAYLGHHEFDSTWIRTDYCFADLTEARALTSFFFGEAPLPMWETEAGVIVPECTGLWWKPF